MTGAPVGSRWWLSSRHWEVSAETTKDGEPAVYLKPQPYRGEVLSKQQAEPYCILTRLLVKHGERKDESE